MLSNLYVVFVCATVQFVSGIIVKDPEPLDEYKYSYVIDDPWTGDIKSLHESRQGAIVTGSYSVLDPDGTRRTVKYVADPTHGFKAVLVQEPVAQPHFSDASPGTLYSGHDYSESHLLRPLSRPKSRNKYFTPSYELPRDKPKHKLFFQPNYRIKL